MAGGKLVASEVPNTITRGSFARSTGAPAIFKPGDRVRTKNIHPATHTRLPRYARSRIGVVEALRGCHVFPDSVAIGKGEDPQWLYTVRFEGRELWGANADPSLQVSIEAFEPYLEPARAQTLPPPTARGTPGRRHRAECGSRHSRRASGEI